MLTHFLNQVVQALIMMCLRNCTVLQKTIEQNQQQWLNSARQAKGKSQVMVNGVGNLLTHMARCCHPVRGDDIVGFITHSGITIHRRGCDQLKHMAQKSPERLVEAAKLRMAETDRMLEKQGLTREQVMAFHFTGAQREAVNRELERLGMAPLEDEPEEPGPAEAPCEPYSAPPPSAATDTELAARQRKFGMMMKPFQI